MATVGSDHILDGSSPAVQMFTNVQQQHFQSATQIVEISQESSNSISKDEWLISVENYVHDTTDEPQIHRILSYLRDEPSNKKCYDPFLVSIGPYHHGNPQLKAFEELKIPVAHKFFRACRNRVSIQQLYGEVAKVGESARKCYEKGPTKVYEDKLFNKMMFLDACFVFQIMYYFSGTESNDSNWTNMEQDEVDPLKPWSSCLVDVKRDLFLLENQIPFLVLKVLMKFRFKDESEGTKLIQDFLDTIMRPQESRCTNAVMKFVQRMMGCSDQKKEEGKLDMNAPHLLHLLREKLIQSSPGEKNEKKSVKGLLHLLRKCLNRSFTEDKNNENLVTWTSYRSVKELKSAGIHFRPSQTNSVADVKFKSHLIYGTLTLPPIIVDDATKSWLLNLAAYEMCPHGPSDHLIMSYIVLMDSFIDHADDVKELREKGIIVNYLGSDDDLAKLFNEIANGLVFNPFAYANVNQQIENHCKSKAQVWMAEWIHNHFHSPWAFLAFLGAILVIVLTAVQTYFAVLSYEAPRH